MQRITGYLFAAVFAGVLGCGPRSQPTAFENQKTENAHGHSHEHNKMMLEDFGPYHAGLTAHLSQKEGNELDVVFETVDQKAMPLPVLKLTAQSTRSGDDKTYPLEFEPAPKDERKDDPEGKCSRFTARATWMKREDMLTVTLKAPLDGKERKVVWVDFNPKKFAHADE